MKVLIIGAAGFIGSHLVRNFDDLKCDVTGCDIMPIANKRIKFVLIKPSQDDFTDLFKNNSYDLCINASGSASVPFSITNPAEDFRLNVTNVYLILHAIKNYNTRCRFVNFSSAAVYGNPQSLPVSESTPLSPVSPYGFHKMISEQICFEFYKLYEIQTVNLRIFSAYGPGIRKQLLWDISQKIKNNDLVEMFGTGRESRDFIYIDDLIKALDLIIEKVEFTGQVINIASGTETTIYDVASHFVSKYNTGKDVRFNGVVKEGDPLNWRADVSLLRSIGFEPTTSVEDGIEKYINWIKTL